MTNYLSLWIGNLGVVPWFSFLFLRLRPAFLSFNFLLVLVCIVFDAILYPLGMFKKIRLSFVTISICIVKIIISPCCDAKIKERKIEEIFLAKGEQAQIRIENLDSFSVGNKEVIGYKYLKRKRQIIIKAKKLGFSDLRVHTKKGENVEYKIYVTSKRQQLQKMEVAAALQKSGLKVATYSDTITVSGEINNLDTYLLYNQIISSTKLNILPKIKINSDFSNNFISSLYQDFHEAGFDFVSCQLVRSQFYCEYAGNQGLKTIITRYQKNYFVHFSPLKSTSSLKLKFDITLEEKNLDSTRNSGISSLSMPTQPLLEGKQGRLKTNDLQIGDRGERFYFISSPILLVVTDQNFKLELGSNQSLTRIVNNTPIVDYIFSGLKLNGKITEQSGEYLVKYQVLLTKNQNNTLTGPGSSSTALVKLKQRTELLRFHVQSHDMEDQKIPFLSAIPIMGRIFNSKNKTIANLELKVYVTLMEAE